MIGLLGQCAGAVESFLISDVPGRASPSRRRLTLTSASSYYDDGGVAGIGNKIGENSGGMKPAHTS